MKKSNVITLFILLYISLPATAQPKQKQKRPIRVITPQQQPPPQSKDWKHRLFTYWPPFSYHGLDEQELAHDFAKAALYDLNAWRKMTQNPTRQQKLLYNELSFKEALIMLVLDLKGRDRLNKLGLSGDLFSTQGEFVRKIPLPKVLETQYNLKTEQYTPYLEFLNASAHGSIDRLQKLYEESLKDKALPKHILEVALRLAQKSYGNPVESVKFLEKMIKKNKSLKKR